jgi:hypothetical protein
MDRRSDRRAQGRGPSVALMESACGTYAMPQIAALVRLNCFRCVGVIRAGSIGSRGGNEPALTQGRRVFILPHGPPVLPSAPKQTNSGARRWTPKR